MNVAKTKPSPIDYALAPGRIALQVAGDAAAGIAALVAVPGRLLGLLGSAEDALVNLETMSNGVASMEVDMQEMRHSLVRVIEVLEGVEGGVEGMTGAVDGIRGATESLDGQLNGLQESLKHIDLLAARLTRFGGGRRAKAAAREAGEPVELQEVIGVLPEDLPEGVDTPDGA